MYYTEEIQLNQAKALLETCGLSVPEGVDYTAGVFDDAGNLVATGSLKGDMIQGMAVDPACQGEDLMAKVLTNLISHAESAQTLYLFTKPEKVMQFTGLGFRLIAKARPYAALLEWGENCAEFYAETLKEARVATDKDNPIIGGLVMNCNPFTKGHRYLVEQAAHQCDHVYLLVVEENLSRFSFADRLKLVKEGVKDLENVSVLPGGRYAVSTLTFPSYFTKEEKVADAHAAIDSEIFAQVIAPALGITKRFIGTEPLSQVTNIYNETLKQRLPKHGIQVVEIPRLEEDSLPISASRVRELLDCGGAESWKEIERLVPASTFQYLHAYHHQVTLKELLDSREQRVMRQRELLDQYDGTLFSVTMNIPGPVKDRPAYRKALETGMTLIEEKAGKDNVLFKEIRHNITGSEGYLVIDEEAGTPMELKRIAVEIEDAFPAGRLLDIDVMDGRGSVSRGDLGLSARKCLLCQDDAKACARSQKHSMGDLLAKVEELLSVPLQ